MPQAKILSKPFRVAFAGQTIDGRVIEEQWLTDAAQTYNPELYTAEIFPEHWRGLTPGGEFTTQGSVVSLFTQQDTVAGEKSLALYAVISPNANLIEMNRRGEKKYASIEIDPDFRNSGKAYLTGMAVTDSPASVATEAMQFSAKYNNRQISNRIEAVIEFTEQEDKQPSAFAKALQGFKDKLASLGQRNDKQLTEVVEGMTALTDLFAKEQEQASSSVTKLSGQFTELQKQFDDQGKELSDLKEKYALIDALDASKTQRMAATGGIPGQMVTNC